MPHLEDLRDQYEKTPRVISQDLREIIHERGETRTHLPVVKLSIFVALVIAISIFVNQQYGTNIMIFLFMSSPITLGVFIGLIRSSSPMVQLEGKLRIAPLVLGRVVEAPNHLHRPGGEAGVAHVVFCPDKPFDGIYLKDAVKHLRSARQAAEPPQDLGAALAALKAEGEQPPLRLPEAYTPEGAVYLVAVKVNPARLPQRKISDGLVPLLVNVEAGVAVHV